MQNGDVKNFRLSQQLLGRQRHAAAGDGRSVRRAGEEVRRGRVPGASSRRSSATAAPCSSTPTASTSRRRATAKEELLAGLAQVLPKNVWQYVVQIPRMSELGRVFVLQGGTQKNLAALKAQVDYIEKRVPNAEVYLHPHCGEAGAIGAAFEALRVKRRGKTTVRRARSGDRHRVRVGQRRGHALQLLPEQLFAHVHRHQDPRRQDRSLHQRLLLREGHRRERWTR
jgi:hypothetical protein